MKMHRVLTILTVVAFGACGPNDGVDHDLGSNEAESWAVTAWGEQFELFPDFPGPGRQQGRG